jgi:hypothetical protein
MIYSEVVANAVENIAFRLAEKRNGTIVPAELLPYLPVSIELITHILDEVCDESTAIFPESIDGIKCYTFKAAQSKTTDNSSLRVTHCLCCDDDVQIGIDDILCGECLKAVENALIAEAQKNGWPAVAAYEHEICYLAASMSSPVSAEKLASRSRLTVRRMRKKLELMAQSGSIRKEPEMGGYAFPPVPYPRDRYLKNSQIIRALPATITAEVEVRVVHILTGLGLQFIALLALAFWGFPFPFLLMLFFMTAPILAAVIWKHRSKLDSMEIE